VDPPGPHRGRVRHRRAASAQRCISHVRAVRRTLPALVGPPAQRQPRRPASTASGTMTRLPLTYIAPAAVGLLFLLGWGLWVAGFNTPVYIVPSPLLVARTLVHDAPLLFGSLLVTLRITALALLLSVVLGVAIAFLFVQSRAIEVSLFPYAVLLQV